MTKKSNPKNYMGKKRLYVSVPRAPRISRLWIWNERANEYLPPQNGKPYMTGRYEVGPAGTRKRRYQFFASVEEARIWQNAFEVPLPVIESKVFPAKEGLLFRELIEQWKRRRFPQLAHGTRLQYEKLIQLYMQNLMDLSIHEITPSRVDQWLDELKAPESPAMLKKTRQSFDHELRLLTTLLKYYFNYHDDPHFQMPIKQRHRDAIRLKRNMLLAPKHKNIPRRISQSLGNTFTKKKRAAASWKYIDSNNVDLRKARSPSSDRSCAQTMGEILEIACKCLQI